MSENRRKQRQRIVSKEDYLARVAKREAKRWGSVAMACTVGACFVGTFFSVFGLIFMEGLLWKCLCFVGAVVPFGIGCALFGLAERTMQEAMVKLDVVPLTRANESDLRAPDVLVRASQEPLQEQRAELLRSAQYGKETPADELLRATNGQRQDV
ncbi:MAG: hypothetical protein JWL77_1412 [Chthonomonadaceae bacterium]|nr:hypothetical protein [Chthonomonadaceae bacterium]